MVSNQIDVDVDVKGCQRMKQDLEKWFSNWETQN